MTSGNILTSNNGLILGESPEKILVTVNAVNAILLTMKEYSEAFGEKGKAGAILNIASIVNHEIVSTLLLNPFGFVPMDEIGKCTETTERKFGQLLDNPYHVSSYESRDGVIFWGGAYIIAKLNALIAISGLPELGDEAVGLGTGLELGWINLNFAVEVAKISDNFLFTALCPKLPSYSFYA